MCGCPSSTVTIGAALWGERLVQNSRRRVTEALPCPSGVEQQSGAGHAHHLTGNSVVWQPLCCLNRFGHHRPNDDDRHIGMRTRAQCVRTRDHMASTAFPRGRIAGNAGQVLVHGPG
jgi:hypothetical protein